MYVEQFGEDFMKEHLEFELEKYRKEGLRPEYQKGISLLKPLVKLSHSAATKSFLFVPIAIGIQVFLINSFVYFIACPVLCRRANSYLL